MKNYNELRMLKRYNIPSDDSLAYRHRQHKYAKLQDAINFDKIEHEQEIEDFRMKSENRSLPKKY